jgi:hypothetical protein
MTFSGRVFRRKRQVDREVREEIDFYLEMRSQEFEREGMSPEDARRAAEQAFGDPGRVKDRVVREAGMRARWTGWKELGFSVFEDLRYAVRGLKKEFGFTLVAVVTLVLGIGANSAIYSVTSQVLLRVPPVADADRVVAVYTTSRRGFPRASSSYPDYIDYRDRTSGFGDLAAHGTSAGLAR